MTQLELSEVRFAYPTASIDVSFTVPSGERLVLVGPSGCGKTTVLRLISGLLEPSSGRITLGGDNVVGRRPELRGTAMVFQDQALFPFRTVGDNVGYGLRVRGVSRADRAPKVSEALASVDLAGFEDRWPDELSGGQRQRVALARAVVVEPQVLLLDEPLTGLDPELRVAVRETICALQRDLAMTTVIVTHDRDDADAMADQLIAMDQGRVLAEAHVSATGAC